MHAASSRIQPSKRTPPTLAVVLLASLALVACSMQRLAYNNADWLLLERIDDYVELDHVQRGLLAEALAAELEAHRREELPAIAGEVERAIDAFEDGLDPSEARWLVEAVRARGRNVMARVVPRVAEVLATLDETQREELAEGLSERNRELRRTRYVDASREERVARRTESMVERIEFITGDLDDRQVAIVRYHRERMPDDAAEWLRFAERRNQMLMAQLASGIERDALTRLLERSFVSWADMPGPLRRNHYRKLDVLVDMLVELTASLSAEQRAHTRDVLTGLRDDMRALAADS